MSLCLLRKKIILTSLDRPSSIQLPNIYYNTRSFRSEQPMILFLNNKFFLNSPPHFGALNCTRHVRWLFSNRLIIIQSATKNIKVCIFLRKKSDQHWAVCILEMNERNDIFRKKLRADALCASYVVEVSIIRELARTRKIICQKVFRMR